MFIYIPGEVVALVTFPGVVLHEVSHRFFCDITNVDVYAISYFKPLSKKSGHVISQPTNNLFHKFLISTGPLIINSLVCMALTFPAGCNFYLGTWCVVGYASFSISLAYGVMAWIGYSVGFNAIPSNQDMNGLVGLAQSRFVKAVLYVFTKIIALFNAEAIGFFLHIGFAFLLSLILPWLFLG
jgi:hypothetical protein